MSDRRQEPRVPTDLEVQITALSEDGSPFSDCVIATNISVGGALLSRLNHKLRCGDLVRVRHGNHQARFRVVWIANSAHGPFTAAIHKLKDDPCPWAEALSESAASISK
jgi:hypothetical protein